MAGCCWLILGTIATFFAIVALLMIGLLAALGTAGFRGRESLLDFPGDHSGRITYDLIPHADYEAAFAKGAPMELNLILRAIKTFITNKVAVEKAVSEVMKVKIPHVVITQSDVRAHGQLLLGTHMSLVQREIAEMNVRLMRAFAVDTPYAVALDERSYLG